MSSPRKRRLARLWMSGREQSSDIALTENDWKRMESALGHELTEEDKTYISGLCQKYTEDLELEQNAPFVNDALRWTEKALNAAGELGVLLLEPLGNELQREAAFVAQSSIAYKMRNAAEEAYTREALLLALQAFIGAATETHREIEEKANSGWGIVEGKAWTSMIMNLRDHARSRGWKPTTSKGQLKSRTHSHSRFVLFVHALQESLPEKARRYSHSLDGLAKAVSEAKLGPEEERERRDFIDKLFQR